MKKIFTICIALITLGAIARHKDSAKAEELSSDFNFAQLIHQDDIFEIQLGQLAAIKAHSSAIRDLGKVMAEDCQKDNDELEKLAMEKKIPFTEVLSHQQQEDLNKLQQLEGPKFDMEYTRCIKKWNREILKLYIRESNKGNDLRLKEWADVKYYSAAYHLHLAKVFYRISSKYAK